MPLKTETLASMCEAVVDCPHSTPVWTDSGFVVLRNQNIKDGRLDLTTPSYTDEEHFKHRTRRLAPRAGDIVITREAPMGDVCKIPEGLECCLGQRQVLLRPRSDVDPDYLLYALQSPFVQNQIRWNEGTGSTVSNVRIPVLEKIDIPRHGDAESNIAKMLSSVDAKIDLNRRINQTLEAMAQAIFKSWFVDFDPVKAKIAAKQEGRDPLRAAMRAISGKPDADLDTLPPEHYAQLAATAALFPDEMEESELGEIPRGWNLKSVGDVAQFASGKVGVSSLNEDIYISTENMLENRAGVTRASSLPFVASVPSFKVGQILVSNIRPYFKKIWMARFDGGRSPDVLAFEPADSQWTEFLYNLMYRDAFFEFMTRTAKGAKMPRGDKDAIIGWKFPCPDEFLMTEFSKKVRPYHVYIASLNSANKSLAELRDTLLPKLLSGELSVTGATAEAEV
jgi:type I restriction enzyme S subunit